MTDWQEAVQVIHHDCCCGSAQKFCCSKVVGMHGVWLMIYYQCYRVFSLSFVVLVDDDKMRELC